MTANKRPNNSKGVQAILERSRQEARSLRRSKRLAQHQHWMRVMMEGQATPDFSYQKPKV